MAAQNLSDPAQLNGVSVEGSDGSKIGKVTDVYLDDQTSKPEWAAVKTGMFGGHVSLVPLANASFDGAALKPVERIHLSKYVVTDNQVVAATLGHEVVEQVHDDAPIDPGSQR